MHFFLYAFLRNVYILLVLKKYMQKFRKKKLFIYAHTHTYTYEEHTECEYCETR